LGLCEAVTIMPAAMRREKRRACRIAGMKLTCRAALVLNRESHNRRRDLARKKIGLDAAADANSRGCQCHHFRINASFRALSMVITDHNAFGLQIRWSSLLQVCNDSLCALLVQDQRFTANCSAVRFKSK
jgi:hypothetical protein